MLEKLIGREADVLGNVNFQLLLLATVIAPLGPTLISPLLDTLTGTFGVTTSEIGLMMSVYTAPSILFIPIIGQVADRFGRKPVLVLSLFFFGFAGSAIALTTNFKIVLFFRFIQGLAGAGIVPILITSTGDLFSDERETTAQGIRLSITGISQTLFPLLAGILIAIAWQYPILIYLLAVPISLLIARDMDESGPVLTRGSIRPSNFDVSSSVSRFSESSLVAFLRRPHILMILIARALVGFIFYTFLTYNSFIVIRGIGGTAAKAGLLVAVYSILLSVSASQSGRTQSYFGNRKIPLLGLNAALGIGVIMISFSNSMTSAILGTVLIGVGMGPVLTLYRSIITEIASVEFRGSLVGISEALGRLGSTLAPIALGVLIVVLEPSVGSVRAVRLAAFAGGIIGSVGGIVAVVLFFKLR